MTDKERIEKEAKDYYRMDIYPVCWKVLREGYTEGATVWAKKLNQKEHENRELREALKQHLPADCIAGYSEVKFCLHRNGEGWKCKHCTI